MNTSTILCEDYFVPEKPQPKISTTVLPDKKPKDFNAWIQHVYELLNKTKKR